MYQLFLASVSVDDPFVSKVWFFGMEKVVQNTGFNDLSNHKSMV
jgi:hypothetical protein